MTINNKKILFCTESSHLHSGFGNYSRAIISRLYKKGYNVAELSCYRSKNQPKIEPWKIYPAAIPQDHPNHKDYMADNSNQFGKFVFDFVVLDFQPDIVIDFRDYWMFAYQEISVLRDFFYWIVAPTIDSTPLLLDTMINLSNADMVLTHTDWASQVLKKLDTNNRLNLGGVINDSVDSDIFHPIKDKHKHRNKYNISDSSFIIGSVLRNQKRKLIPELLSILQKLIAQNPEKNILLYLHTSYPEINGWNIPELLLEYGVESNVLFTYKCKQCSHTMIKKYGGPNVVCDKCNKKAGMASVTNGVTDSELCEIYNIFDIYLQYSICEGFGIPQVEAVACGLPLITIKHGAMEEVGNNLGAYLVDIQKEFRETDSNAIRVYPNNDHAIKLIQSLMGICEQIPKIGRASRNKLLKSYSWDITADNLANIIDNIKLDNMDWDSPARIGTIDQSPINYNGNNKLFVEHIVNNIIKQPELMKSSYISNIIHNLDQGIVLTDKGAIPFDINRATKTLEIYLKQKILIEKIRTKEVQMPSAFTDIINYS